MGLVYGLGLIVVLIVYYAAKYFKLWIKDIAFAQYYSSHGFDPAKQEKAKLRAIVPEKYWGEPLPQYATDYDKNLVQRGILKKMGYDFLEYSAPKYKVLLKHYDRPWFLY